MSAKYLGETFDIHGGGAGPDLPPPRERDRPERGGAPARPFARYWMHCGFLDLEGAKMSKSPGQRGAPARRAGARSTPRRCASSSSPPTTATRWRSRTSRWPTPKRAWSTSTRRCARWTSASAGKDFGTGPRPRRAGAFLARVRDGDGRRLQLPRARSRRSRASSPS